MLKRRINYNKFYKIYDKKKELENMKINFTFSDLIYIICIGVLSIGYSILFTVFVYTAYNNNGIVILDFNRYNEMISEMVILPTFLIMSVIISVKLIKKIHVTSYFQFYY